MSTISSITVLGTGFLSVMKNSCCNIVYGTAAMRSVSRGGLNLASRHRAVEQHPRNMRPVREECFAKVRRARARLLVVPAEVYGHCRDQLEPRPIGNLHHRDRVAAQRTRVRDLHLVRSSDVRDDGAH